MWLTMHCEVAFYYLANRPKSHSFKFHCWQIGFNDFKLNEWNTRVPHNNSVWYCPLSCLLCVIVFVQNRTISQIPGCTFSISHVHISVLNGELRDKEQVYSGISELGQLHIEHMPLGPVTWIVHSSLLFATAVMRRHRWPSWDLRVGS